MTQEYQRGLALGQSVLQRLETFSLETLSSTLSYELFRLIDDIAYKQLYLKQYGEAEQSYQKALAFLRKNENLDTATINKQSATLYHQLGMVAHEQRQFEQAEQYYQHALQVYVEYKDTYHTAMTLRNLARLWKESNNKQLPATVAQILHVSVADVESMWQDGSESHNGEKNNDDEKS